tara:strand:+ start:2964 stop:3818 length:855 start_codon:yes stop_codon:yes gene_type:complete
MSKYIDNIFIFITILSIMKFNVTLLNPFNYHIFRIYIYHPFLFFYNCLRYSKSSLALLIKNFSSNEFSVYGFKIVSPKKIDKYYFANLNAKFNSFMLNKYEVNEKILIEKYLTQNDIVLELGGCIGVISLVINRIINNNGAHVVLEIDKNKFEYLELNKQVNHANFKLFNGALSDKKNLYYEESNSFWGGKVVESENSKLVNCYNLTELEQKSNLKFNTLVMDIEGGETEIINELDLTSFNKLLFEIHFDRNKDEYRNIEKQLNKNNFVKKDSHGRVEYWERRK